MRKSLALLMCCAAIACRQNEPGAGKPNAVKRTEPTDASKMRVDTVIQPVPVFLDKSLLGTQLGPDGTVSKEALEFDSGQPVYLTMIFKESPVGLHSHVVWRDAKKKQIRTEDRPMNGAKSVTFTLDTRKLKPGVYHVVGYWGGNIAAERDFGIGPAARPRKK